MAATNTLPPLPPSLKSISPFMLRAEELRRSDPVMSYWCTYYAAQAGLDLKTHEAGAREYLLALITRLEKTKEEFGSNDAIESQAVGAAYVENFGLKVFANADNEDRKGLANRTTAKKFLAAANFLELLKVFVKSDNAELNEEKIRYAKWRASEIARAIREGRKPTPPAQDDTLTNEDVPLANSPNRSHTSLQTTANRSPPPPPIVIDAPTAPSHPTRGGAEGHFGAISPGNWSTVATPGDDGTHLPSMAGRWGGQLGDSSAVVDGLGRGSGGFGVMDRGHSGSTLVDGHTIASTDIIKTLDGAAPPPALPKKVHFTPSVAGGTSITDGSLPPSPTVTGSSPQSYAAAHNIPFSASPVVDIPRKLYPTVAPLPDSSPSSSSLEGSPRRRRGSKSGGSPPRVVPLPPPSTHVPSSSPPSEARSSSKSSSRHSPPHSTSRLRQPSPPKNTDSLPSHSYSHSISSESNRIHTQPSAPVLPNEYSHHTMPHSPPAPSQPPYAIPPPPPIPSAPYEVPILSHQYPYPQTHAPPPPPPEAKPPPLELTPSLIAKVQKHCRFAISALEYEDAEQAKKELRTALEALGEKYGP